MIYKPKSCAVVGGWWGVGKGPRGRNDHHPACPRLPGLKMPMQGRSALEVNKAVTKYLTWLQLYGLNLGGQSPAGVLTTDLSVLHKNGEL